MKIEGVEDFELIEKIFGNKRSFRDFNEPPWYHQDDEPDLYRVLRYLEIEWFPEDRVEEFKDMARASKSLARGKRLFFTIFCASTLMFYFTLCLFLGMIRIYYGPQLVVEPLSFELAIISSTFLITGVMALVFCPLLGDWSSQWLETYAQAIPDIARTKLKQVQQMLSETQGYITHHHFNCMFELRYKEQTAVITYWQSTRPRQELELPLVTSA